MPALVRLRLVLIHIAGGIIGIWIGVLIFMLISSIGSYLFPPPACSGIPLCGSSEILTLLTAGVGGGAIGAATGYRVPQYLLRRPVIFARLYGYALVGSMLWIVIGFLTFLAVAMSGLERTIGWEITSAAVLTLIGILIGLVRVGLVRDT
jgi:hypothetical protein